LKVLISTITKTNAIDVVRSCQLDTMATRGIYQAGLRYCSTCQRTTIETGVCSDCHRKLRTTPANRNQNRRRNRHKTIIYCSDCRREDVKIYNKKNMLCTKCYNRRHWHKKARLSIPKPIAEPAAKRIRAIFAERLVN
jgi:hypothetical protein